jgi:hypothetical protein
MSNGCGFILPRHALNAEAKLFLFAFLAMLKILLERVHLQPKERVLKTNGKLAPQNATCNLGFEANFSLLECMESRGQCTIL